MRLRGESEIDLTLCEMFGLNKKAQASSLKPQASSLKPQASSLKPQASSLKPRSSGQRDASPERLGRRSNAARHAA